MPRCSLRGPFRLQIVNETLPALLELKEEGLVRHIGITGLPLAVYSAVLDRCAAERRPLCFSGPLVCSPHGASRPRRAPLLAPSSALM